MLNLFKLGFATDFVKSYQNLSFGQIYPNPNLTYNEHSSERGRAVVRGGRGDHAAEQGRAGLVEGPDRRGQSRRVPRQLRRARGIRVNINLQLDT